MADERGVIKFSCGWKQTGALPSSQIRLLNKWRTKLFGAKLIGAYPDGVGYGNISERIGDSNTFVITGSATGNLPVLDGKHYTKVVSYSFRDNSLSCEGPIKASSESLTHAAVYESESSVKAVIHVHSLSMWEQLIDKLPTTSRDVEYGTPEMAAEMIRLLKEHRAKELGIIIMGGHKEGIVTFGKSLDEAGNVLMKYYQQQKL